MSIKDRESRPDQKGESQPAGKRISDTFRRIDLSSNGARSTLVLIQAVTRALLALLVVVIGGYLLINRIPVPRDALPIAYLILGAYFGLESVAKFLSRIEQK